MRRRLITSEFLRISFYLAASVNKERLSLKDHR